MWDLVGNREDRFYSICSFTYKHVKCIQVSKESCPADNIYMKIQINVSAFGKEPFHLYRSQDILSLVKKKNPYSVLTKTRNGLPNLRACESKYSNVQCNHRVQSLHRKRGRNTGIVVVSRRIAVDSPPFW